jgi:GxxExxY protein
MTLNRGGAETRSSLIHSELTEQIIGAAIEVHRELGPGLLESAYEECLCHEFRIRNLSFAKQVSLPVFYKGVKLDCGYTADLIVEDAVVLELKCVEQVLPVHEAQLITYLRLTNLKVGFLLNFYTDMLTRGGIIRKVLEKPKTLRASASPRFNQSSE